MAHLTLTPMDWVRGALLNALTEDLSVVDLCAMAEHARTAEEFDNAVNELVQATDYTGASIRDDFRDLFPK